MAEILNSFKISIVTLLWMNVEFSPSHPYLQGHTQKDTSKIVKGHEGYFCMAEGAKLHEQKKKERKEKVTNVHTRNSQSYTHVRQISVSADHTEQASVARLLPLFLVVAGT